MKDKKDPIGEAILEYDKTKKPADIIVHSNLCEDDIIPVEVLFRKYKDMPAIEKKALSLCKGKVLDIGAGSGTHSKHLLEKGFDVICLESSEGAYRYLSSKRLNVVHKKFDDFTSNEKFDTILMMMNGIGIAKNLDNLAGFLKKAQSMLHEKGQILFDSSDVLYLYENEDGSFELNLNESYYGDFKFQMEYKSHLSEWFEWLYVDYDNMHKIATEIGFSCNRIMSSDHHYLAQLIKN